MTLTLVAGTWAWKPEHADDAYRWWQPKSAFAQMLRDAGQTFACDLPFIWSTDDDTILNRRNSDWRAGGMALFYYLQPVACAPALCVRPRTPNSLIAHSHGGQVALYAAAAGLKIDTLITVATPVRGDMQAVIENARPNIRFWRHLYGGWRDYVQLLGELGNGGFGLHRTFAAADENIRVPGVSHSGFLNDPRFFPRWRQDWLVFRGDPASTPAGDAEK